MNQHSLLDPITTYEVDASSNSIPNHDQRYVSLTGFIGQNALNEKTTILQSGDVLSERESESSFKVPDVPPPPKNSVSDENLYFHQSQEQLNNTSTLGSQIIMPSGDNGINEGTSGMAVASNGDEWYDDKRIILANASYLTSPTKTELLAQMVNEVLQDYEKAKEEGEQEIIKMQELIQSNAAKAIEDIASKWSEECSRREEEIRLKLEQIQEKMASNEGLETELSHFTDGMRDMYRLMQDQN